MKYRRVYFSLKRLPMSFQGKILEPSSIYNYLLNSLSPTDTFKVVEGRQEDAEEFLTFLLNGLNDEMLALLKSVEKEREPSEQAGSNQDQAGKNPSNH